MEKISAYYDGSDILTEDNGSEDYFRISPSGMSKFFSSTTQWCRENLLGEEGFTGSTSTILGSIVHYFAEQAALGKPPRDADQLVADYLDSQTIEFDRAEVEEHWRDMANVLNTECVFPTQKQVHSVEQFIYEKVLPGVYIAGTYDALISNGNGTYTVRDYKTAAKKPSSFSYDYKIQALAYAWVLRKRGFNISHVELQYVVKPTKTLPVRHVTFTHAVTEEDMLFIENVIKLIADYVKTWKEKPELRYILAQDYRLKETKVVAGSMVKDIGE